MYHKTQSVSICRSFSLLRKCSWSCLCYSKTALLSIPISRYSQPRKCFLISKSFILK